MYGLILRRIAAAILTISVLTVFVFALLYLFPGDPAERILQTRMNGELPLPGYSGGTEKGDGADAPPYQLYLNWPAGCCMAIWATLRHQKAGHNHSQ